MTVFTEYGAKSSYFEMQNTLEGLIQFGPIDKSEQDKSFLGAFDVKQVHLKF